MALPVSAAEVYFLPPESCYSALSPDEKRSAEKAARELAEEVYAGLDLSGEIRTVTARSLGDTLLMWEGSRRLAGFAVCHWGPASEAGAGMLYIKFGVVRQGRGASGRFAALLEAAAALARSVGMSNLSAGVNLAREVAYRQMLALGFRSSTHLVTMHRPNEPGYSRPGLFVLDDWR